MQVKKSDPIPESFDSYEAAVEFWDTHDTADYLEDFETVEVHTEFRRRHFEIELAEDVIIALRQKAKHQGVSLERLANDILREQVLTA
ncbi:MAG: CopG family antitoxin [Caldilineaceae bacterium]